MSLIIKTNTPGGGAPSEKSPTRRSFRELTRRYFTHETKWQFIIEAVLFGIIIAISAWPIFAAADALRKFV